MRSADERRAAFQRGIEAEQAVVDRYVSAGWSVLDRNLRIGGAELDIVLLRHGSVRFVEVKLRQSGDPMALDAITPDKQRRLVRGARAFLQSYEDLVEEAVIDVVFVWRSSDGSWDLDVWANAFDA